ncbi:50S ribosomal protein L6 [Lignipirellula cremea]|uniref:Large ribosomal subunit protein uL6 n=1 Tax=Lignipirellula cremea TaxID=2528010 RepID=A0A518DMX7_9BACT|nr:50S ribosomal protein L6 [Lignipirellula cremea]QDU93195.1 50S ribosomal protein L6 [Lignipirellula cremea]
MSRVGNKPVPMLDGVKVSLEGRTIKVEGPGGAPLSYTHRPEVEVTIDEDSKTVRVARINDERESRAYHGLTRAIINNMIVGAKTGYEKRLEIVGVGYGATLQGKLLELRVGFANKIQKHVPDGVDVTVPTATQIVVKGSDKQKVGQFAAEVRAARKPEPYKGKGIRYAGEQVKIKAGKAAS